MIHKYSLNNFNIVLDINSGAAHIFDDCSFELLDHISPPVLKDCPQILIDTLGEKYEYNDIISSYEEIFELYIQGALFSDDDYLEYSDYEDDAPIKAMCLHVAHDCNLRCSYCFAAQGDFNQGRKLMPLSVGKQAIDFLIMKSGQRRNLEVDFFGGEPLMNYDTVKDIVAYARSLEKKHNKNFRFTITTNGLLLNDEIIDSINQEMSNVVLSIDGRKDINDKMRYRRDGSGSYDSIMPKYKKFVEKRQDKQYYVRGTFTKNNLDFSEDVMSLYENGFDQISIEPVVSDPSLEYSITEADLEIIFKEYERLANKIIENREAGEFFNFFHFMLDLEQGSCAIKRMRGCGCGNEYVAVTPEGYIYPCHQFVGLDEWKMGDLSDGKLDMDMKKQFAKANIYQKSDCKNCWAKFYCSGGCNANNFQYSGDIYSSHKLSCELEKKRLECAIMIKAALTNS